jgi:ketosteroid isomerase-like protein/catechol 2,3-dioxygenase-like lactoylglutathione lyase family enzyme
MTHQASDRDRLALHDIRARLEAAENSGNAAYIGEMMADDVVVMVPNEPVKEGKAACAGFIRDVLEHLHAAFHRRIAYQSDEVSVLGDLAFDRGRFAFTVRRRDDGTTTEAAGKYFWVYSRDADQGWKLSRLVASLDDEDEAAPRLEIGSVVIACYEFDRMRAFWGAALGYVPREPPSPGWCVLRDPDGRRPNVSLNQVPTKQTGRSRLHLDLYTADRDAEVERLTALGAKPYPWRNPDGADFVVLEDPEGHLFCVVQQGEC